jgi:diguanylate cyclase (GGDEF)-like protein
VGNADDILYHAVLTSSEQACVSDQGSEISREPLWAVPAPIQERLQSRLRDREYSHFRMCGLYSAVAITFLLFFGFAALGRGETTYGFVIIGFAIATTAVYVSAWYSRNYFYTKHFLTLLMGLLCLYLYYTGGTGDTGPLYYFVFPLVAVFLQSLRAGIVSVLVLLAATLVLETGAFGFDTSRYSTLLVIRIVAIYLIVAMLSFLFEYFRLRAEQELLLSLQDLSLVTYGDMGTHLANRRLMEKLLFSEIGRAKRYPVDGCVMLVEADEATRLRGKHLEQLRLSLSLLLRRQLRMQDIPGVWDDSRFLVLLPLTPVEGAVAVAERLLTECRKQQLAMPGEPARRMTISIGLVSVRQPSAEALIEAVSDQLLQALREGGNRLAVEST